MGYRNGNTEVSVDALNQCPIPHMLLNDTVPDAFEFIDVINAVHYTVVESNTVTLTGFSVPLPICVEGGEYSVNGGMWTSLPSTVVNGDRVKLRLTTNFVSREFKTARLTVGGVFSTFTVSTTSDIPQQRISEFKDAVTDAVLDLTMPGFK